MVNPSLKIQCRSCKRRRDWKFFPHSIVCKTRAGQKCYPVCRDCLKKKRKESQLRRYGLDGEKYQEMWDRQRGHCAICGMQPKKLHVDHCHFSGRTRELLCNKCNLLLGLAKENSEVLRQAVKYLDKHNAVSTL